jgi:quinol monooxygenase YgiN
MDDTGNASGLDEASVTVLVEWPTKGLDLAAARTLARDTEARLRRVPGLIGARFFGDFESETHVYLLTWRDRAALDAYTASEEMFGVRSLAEPYVAGRPTRRIFVDYSPRTGEES